MPQHFFFFFFFAAEADTKKHRHASAKASNAALVRLTDWITKNDRVTCVVFLQVINMAKQAMLFDSPQRGF